MFYAGFRTFKEFRRLVGEFKYIRGREIVLLIRFAQISKFDFNSFLPCAVFLAFFVIETVRNPPYLSD